MLQILQTFFMSNFPNYTEADARDRPTYFDPDLGNLPKFEMDALLNDCLICFD